MAKKKTRKIISSSHPVLLLKKPKATEDLPPIMKKVFVRTQGSQVKLYVFLLIFLTTLWVAVMNISFAYSQTEIICYMLILMMRLCLGLLS